MKSKIFLLSIFVMLFAFAVTPALAQEDGTTDSDTAVDTTAVDETVDNSINTTSDDVEEDLAEVEEDENITADDLGVAEPSVLPGDGLYFLRKWRRAVQKAITFNPAKKATLEVRHASEQLLEAKKLAEETGDDTLVEEAVANYEATIENIKTRVDNLKENSDDPNVSKFLDKFVDHQKIGRASCRERV